MVVIGTSRLYWSGRQRCLAMLGERLVGYLIEREGFFFFLNRKRRKFVTDGIMLDFLGSVLWVG